MAEISWTDEAQSWLRDIFEYIAAENPDAARRVVSGIFEKVQILRVHPDKGDIRILLYGHYRVAYLVAGESVIVLGVFHGALEIERYLP